MKLLKLLIILYLISINYSCKTINNYHDVSGKYIINRKYGITDYLLHRKRVVGDSIFLGKNKSYYYGSCITKDTGFWEIRNNSLILHCKKRVFKQDSLYKHFKIDTLTCKEDIFKIKKNRLVRKFKPRHIIEFVKINE